MSSNWIAARRGLLWGAGLGLVGGGIPAFAVAGSTYKWGLPAGWIATHCLVPLLTIAALIALGLGIALVVSADRRHLGITISIAAVLVAVAGPTLLWPAFQIRQVGLERFATRASDPVVDAIESYVEEHGRAPESLDELVPAYLPSIPSSGLASDTSGYRCHTPGSSGRDLGRQPWLLTVNLKARFLGDDVLIFAPEPGYEPRFTEFGTHRIGRWFVEGD